MAPTIPSARVLSNLASTWRHAEGRWCGAAVVTFKDIAITAALIQKSTLGNWPLLAALVKDGKRLDRQSTSAEYGVVTLSGSDF